MDGDKGEGVVLGALKDIERHGSEVGWDDAVYLLAGQADYARALSEDERERHSDARSDAWQALEPTLQRVYEAMMGEPFEPLSPISEMLAAVFDLGWDAKGLFDAKPLPSPPRV